MNILLFNNAAFNNCGDDLCINPSTSIFVMELKKLGHDITMFGYKTTYDQHSHSTFKLKEHGIKCVSVKMGKFKLISQLNIYLKLIFVISKYDYLYFFFPANSLMFMPLISILFKKKYGIYIRGMRRLNFFCSKYIYKHANNIFTVSDNFTDFINNKTKINISKTVRPIIPYNSNDIVNDRAYLKSDTMRILFLGSVTKEKGIIELINAANSLVQKQYNFCIFVVGDGDYLNISKELVEKFNISNYFNFKGPCFEPEKIKNYYLNSDLFVLPTYFEGFPRTLYESMLFKTPIITTFVGGISTIMLNDYNCKEIVPRSVDSLISNIEFAINNYDFMTKLASNANETIKKILDPNKLTHAESLNEEIITL